MAGQAFRPTKITRLSGVTSSFRLGKRMEPSEFLANNAAGERAPFELLFFVINRPTRLFSTSVQTNTAGLSSGS